MQEGEQESSDFVLAQSADGRRRAAAEGGAASVQLWGVTTQVVGKMMD